MLLFNVLFTQAQTFPADAFVVWLETEMTYDEIANFDLTAFVADKFEFEGNYTVEDPPYDNISQILNGPETDPDSVHQLSIVLDFRSDFTAFRVQNHSASTDFLRIIQWGNRPWAHFNHTFDGVRLTQTDPPLDVPNLTACTSFSYMFHQLANGYNQPLVLRFAEWDVSNVNDFSYMFATYAISNASLEISNWNTSNATNMERMFFNNETFNQPLGNWDVSNVVNMDSMFGGAYSFGYNISTWNFHPEVVFSTPNSWNNFIEDGAFSTDYYDLLLYRFYQLGLTGKYLMMNGHMYCDSYYRDNLILAYGWDIIDSGQDPYCNNNNNYNVYAYIQLDEDQDGCGFQDPYINNVQIEVNDGFDTNRYYTNNGFIAHPWNLMAYTLTPVPFYGMSINPVEEYFDIYPYLTDYVFYFCASIVDQIPGLRVRIVPISNTNRPGFISTYHLLVENIGSVALSDITIVYTYFPAYQTLYETSDPYTVPSANELHFSIGSLGAYATKSIEVRFQNALPDTMLVDSVFTTSISGLSVYESDTAISDQFTLHEVVRNSFDPNDKTVLQGSQIILQQAQEELQYRIRFQNTGNAAAQFIRIVDQLHHTLDPTTFRIIDSSHPYMARITSYGEIEFMFDNINLPPEMYDEENSHGYIIYSIKPMSGLQIGDIIHGNSVAIYFDYNSPIYTNATETEIVTELSVNSPNGNHFKVQPNPTRDKIYIQTHSQTLLHRVQIYNLQGQKLLEQTLNNDSSASIDLQSLANGVYILHFQTSLGQQTTRIIKN